MSTNKFNTTLGIYRQSSSLSSKACIVVRASGDMFMSFVDKISTLQVPLNVSESYSSNIKTLFDAIKTDIDYNPWSSDMQDAQDDSIFEQQSLDKYKQLQYQMQWGARHVDMDVNMTFAPLWIFDSIPEYFVSRHVKNNDDAELGTVNDIINQGKTTSYNLKKLGLYDMLNTHLSKMQNNMFVMQLNEQKLTVQGINVDNGQIEQISKYIDATDTTVIQHSIDFVNMFYKNKLVCANTINLLFENDLAETGAYNVVSMYADALKTYSYDSMQDIVVNVVNDDLFFSNEQTAAFASATHNAATLQYYDLYQQFEDVNSFAQIQFVRQPIVGESMFIYDGATTLQIYFATYTAISNTSNIATFKIGSTLAKTVEMFVTQLKQFGFIHEITASEHTSNIVTIEALHNIQLSMSPYATWYNSIGSYQKASANLVYYTKQTLTDLNLMSLTYVKVGTQQISVVYAAKLVDGTIMIVLSQEPTDKQSAFALYTQYPVYSAILLQYGIADMTASPKSDVYNESRLKSAMYAVIDTLNPVEIANVNDIVALVDNAFTININDTEYVSQQDRLQENTISSLYYLGKLERHFIDFCHAYGNASNNLPYYLNFNASYGRANNSYAFDAIDNTYDARRKDWFVVGLNTYDNAIPQHKMSFALNTINVLDIANTTTDVYKDKLTHMMYDGTLHYELPTYTKTYLKHSTMFCYAMFKGIEYRMPVEYYDYRFAVVHIHYTNLDTPVVKVMINNTFKTFTITIFATAYAFNNQFAAYEYLHFQNPVKSITTDSVFLDLKFSGNSNLIFYSEQVTTPVMSDIATDSATLVGISYNLSGNGIDANIEQLLLPGTNVITSYITIAGIQHVMSMQIRYVDTVSNTIWLEGLTVVITELSVSYNFATMTNAEILAALNVLESNQLFTVSTGTVQNERYDGMYAYDALQFNLISNKLPSQYVNVVDPFSISVTNSLSVDNGNIIQNESPSMFKIHRFLGDYVPAADIVYQPTIGSTDKSGYAIVNDTLQHDLLLIGDKHTKTFILDDSINPGAYDIYTKLRIADGLLPKIVDDAYVSEYATILSKTFYAKASTFNHIAAANENIENILRQYFQSFMHVTLANSLTDYLLINSLVTVSISKALSGGSAQILLSDGSIHDELDNVSINDDLTISIEFTQMS